MSNSHIQPELPFEDHGSVTPAEGVHTELPEFISKNPLLLQAWQRGHQRAEYDLGEGKDEQQLPLPKTRQTENSPENESPIDRDSLREVAKLAVFNQLIKEGSISVGLTAEQANGEKTKAELGSKAKTEPVKISKEDLERGVVIEKNDDYGNQGRSPAAARELKKIDQSSRTTKRSR